MELTSKLSSKEILYSTLERKFQRGEPDYITAIAYNLNNEQIDVLLNHKSGDKGLDLLKTELDIVAKERLDITSVVVSVFSSPKSPSNKPRFSYKVDMTKPLIIQQEEVNKEEPENIIERPSIDLEQGLAGIGGINGFLEKVHSTTAENKILEYEKKLLQEENEKLKAEIKELDDENDKLNDANNKLIDEVERLKKYEPGNQTIMGVNAVQFGGALLENALSGFLKKNPKVGKGLLGADNYNAFLNGTSAIQQNAQMANSTATEVEFENDDEASLSPEQKTMLQYAKGVFQWLKQMPAENMQKFAYIIDYIKNDMTKADKLIEFINKQNN